MGTSATALVLIAGASAFFLVMGIVALRRPERVVAYFGTTSLTREGWNEVRAVYGGFGVAVAMLLLATLWSPALKPGVLAAVAASLGGMAAGRFLSALLDGSPAFVAWLFCVLELLLAGVLLFALALSA